MRTSLLTLQVQTKTNHQTKISSQANKQTKI